MFQFLLKKYISGNIGSSILHAKSFGARIHIILVLVLQFPKAFSTSYTWVALLIRLPVECL